MNKIIFHKIIFLTLILLSFIFNAQAQNNYEKIIKNADTITEIKQRISFLNNQASNLISRNYSVAKKLILLAINLADSIKYDSSLTHSYNILGILNFHIGHYKDALSYYYKAYQLYENFNDTGGKSDVENNLGIVYYYIGDYNEALSHYYKALKFNDKLKKERNSSIYNNIGIVLAALKKHKEAYKYYVKSLNIAIKHKDSARIATAFNNMGEVFNNLNQYDSAKIYYAKSLKLDIKLKDKSGKAICYLNLGDIANKEKKYPLAKRNLSIAKKLYLEVGDTVGLIDINFLFAKIYLKENKYKKSLIFFHKAFVSAQKVGYLELQRDLYELLGQIYEQQNRFDLALNAYRTFKSLSDSLSQQNVEKKIANHEQQYEFEKQKKEIEVKNLKERSKQNTIIFRQRQNKNILLIAGLILLIIMVFFMGAYRNKKKYNDELLEKNQEINEHTEELTQTLQQLSLRERQLAELNTTKDQLFSIIGHDLRGPVGSLRNLMELLTEQFDKFALKDIHSMLQTAKESSQQTFLLLENLLLWSSSQKNEVIHSPSYQNLYPIIESNIRLLRGGAKIKSISININVNRVCNAYFDENSVSTIFRNMLSNAIKFTPQEGEINISCKTIDNFIQIEIHDSGIGMDSETVNRISNPNIIFTTFGTNNEKGTGLGLKLCFDLIKQNNGIIKIKSKINEGTTFIFTLPNSQLNE